MSDAGFHLDVCTRANLDKAIQASPPHLKMILEAVRDREIRFGQIRQHQGAFSFPAGLPIVLWVGDDYDLSWGPQAFDRDSIARFVRGATSAVVVAGAPEPVAYNAAVAGAILSGHHSVIIETTERWEGEWLALLRELAPGMPVLLSTPRRKGAAN